MVPGAISLERIRRAVTGVPKYVQVGLPDLPHKDDANLTLAQIGTIHEYGAPSVGIPERPFLHPAITEGRDQIGALNQQVALNVVTGKYGMEQGLGSLGNLGVRLVQEKVTSNIPPPLKQSTIDRKGSQLLFCILPRLLSSI